MPARRQRRWAVLKGGAAFASGSGATFAFTLDDNASHEIGLTVSDEDAAATTVLRETIESVADVAPTATILSISEPRVEGTAITVTVPRAIRGCADGAQLRLDHPQGWHRLYERQRATFAFTRDDNASYETA